MGVPLQVQVRGKYPTFCFGGGLNLNSTTSPGWGQLTAGLPGAGDSLGSKLSPGDLCPAPLWLCRATVLPRRTRPQSTGLGLCGVDSEVAPRRGRSYAAWHSGEGGVSREEEVSGRSGRALGRGHPLTPKHWGRVWLSKCSYRPRQAAGEGRGVREGRTGHCQPLGWPSFLCAPSVSYL